MMPAQRDGLRWLASLCIVLGTHAAVIGGSLWWDAWHLAARDDTPMEAVMVELAPEPEAPPAPPTELPPGPPQQEQAQPEPKPAPRAEPEPPPDTPPQPEPEVVDPYPPPEPQPPDTPQPAEAADIDQTTAPPSAQSTPSDRYAARQTTSGAGGQAAITWQGVLLAHLEHYRRYPRQAERHRVEGVAYVRFAVDRKGNVSRTSLYRSSGHAPLDQEALDTLVRASPVPPPPEEIRDDPVEVITPVSFFIRRR